jgi:hypothetical protein
VLDKPCRGVLSVWGSQDPRSRREATSRRGFDAARRHRPSPAPRTARDACDSCCEIYSHIVDDLPVSAPRSRFAKGFAHLCVCGLVNIFIDCKLAETVVKAEAAAAARPAGHAGAPQTRAALPHPTRHHAVVVQDPHVDPHALLPFILP